MRGNCSNATQLVEGSTVGRRTRACEVVRQVAYVMNGAVLSKVRQCGDVVMGCAAVCRSVSLTMVR